MGSLEPVCHSVLFWPHSGYESENMQRLTARLLFLFALAGTFVPVTLQALTPPPHACCLRKSAHRCHTTGAQDPVVRSADCCNHDCSHAVVTSQWAHPEALL